jgi:glycosyltransferase involved in cell wall biosynthesis
MLETGLGQVGVEVVRDPNDGLSWRWLLRHRIDIDVIHFHWLQYHYERETTTQSGIALIKFAAKLALAVALGYRLVWTVHNLQPHELRYGRLDRICRHLMYRLVDDVVVHCNEARRQLEAWLGHRGSVSVIPHPNYIGIYPEVPGQQAARDQLGLDTSGLVFLCFGAVRPYKGIQDAIIAFRRIPDDHARLIIAGRPVNESIRQEINSLTQEDNRILTVLDFVPTSEVPRYYASADVVLLPFHRITTSGSVVLALSLSRPIIAPSLGCLPELVAADAGILYDPVEPDALLNAMKQCQERDLVSMARQAYDSVARFTPSDIARQYRTVYSGG